MAEPTFVSEVDRIDYFDDRVYAIKLTSGEVRRIISITTYLEIAPKPYLAQFYKNNTPEEINRRFEEGRIRGSRLHWAFYILARRGVVLYQPPEWTEPAPKLRESNARIIAQCRQQDRPYCLISDQGEWLQVLRVKKWFQLTQMKVTHCELVVWSLEHDLAGTLDLIGAIEDGEYAIAGSRKLYLETGLYMADYKTGNIDRIIAYAQQAAYLKGLEEDLPEIFNQVRGCLIIDPSATTTTGIPGLTTIFKSKAEVLSEDWPYFQHIQAVWHRHNPNFEAERFDFETIAVLDDNLLSNVVTGQAVNLTDVKKRIEKIDIDRDDFEGRREPPSSEESKRTPGGEKASVAGKKTQSLTDKGGSDGT